MADLNCSSHALITEIKVVCQTCIQRCQHSSHCITSTVTPPWSCDSHTQEWRKRHFRIPTCSGLWRWRRRSSAFSSWCTLWQKDAGIRAWAVLATSWTPEPRHASPTVWNALSTQPTLLSTDWRPPLYPAVVETQARKPCFPSLPMCTFTFVVFTWFETCASAADQ